MSLAVTSDDPFRPIPEDRDPRFNGRLWNLIGLPEIQRRIVGEGIGGVLSLRLPDIGELFLINDTKYWLSMLSHIIAEPKNVTRGLCGAVSYDGELVDTDWLQRTLKQWGETGLQVDLGPYDYVAREVIKELRRLKNKCGIRYVVEQSR